MIKINDDLAVKANKRSFNLCVPVKKGGKLVWQQTYFFTDLNQLFKKVINLALAKGIQDGSWETVAKRLEEVKKDIDDKMDLILTLNTPVDAVRGRSVD